MVIIVLSQVLYSNIVPDCVRSNLRASKFKIFLWKGWEGGGGGGSGGIPPDPATILPQLKILYETLIKSYYVVHAQPQVEIRALLARLLVASSSSTLSSLAMATLVRAQVKSGWTM